MILVFYLNLLLSTLSIHNLWELSDIIVLSISDKSYDKEFFLLPFYNLHKGFCGALGVHFASRGVAEKEPA